MTSSNLVQSFKGKVAIITASSTGIGLAIAKRLASEGCSVVISSRNKTNVDDAVKEITSKGGDAFGVPCHVGDKAQRQRLIEETVKKYGGVDYLICNAAVSTHMGNFLEATESQIQKMWDINYKSVYFLIQEALPHLRKRPNSSIIILASYAACILL
jgi:dehydrogenase/reductase SDR family protein 4